MCSNFIVRNDIYFTLKKITEFIFPSYNFISIKNTKVKNCIYKMYISVVVSWGIFCLLRAFSNGNVWRHFCCHTGACYWNLVGRGQITCQTFYSVQDNRPTPHPTHTKDSFCQNVNRTFTFTWKCNSERKKS